MVDTCNGPRWRFMTCLGPDHDLLLVAGSHLFLVAAIIMTKFVLRWKAFGLGERLLCPSMIADIKAAWIVSAHVSGPEVTHKW
jgi:hypothetical protein